MTINPEEQGSKENDAREINVFSIDKVSSSDELYDFRPTMSSHEDEVEAPKALSATVPVESSSSEITEQQKSEVLASVEKVKSPTKTAASKNG